MVRESLLKGPQTGGNLVEEVVLLGGEIIETNGPTRGSKDKDTWRGVALRRTQGIRV